MNGFYESALRAFARSQINWEADDLRVVIVDAADYTVDLAAHEFLASVPLAARVAVSGALTGKTVTGAGVLDADDLTIPAVTGDASEALIIYKHTGSDATARLVLYLDTGAGLPFTPNGTDRPITWSNGANRIARL